MNRKTKPELQAFRDALARDFAFNAGRLEISDPDTYTHAAAILMSALTMLRSAAQAKPLTADDLQVAVTATFDALAIEEHRAAMGSLVYRHAPAKVTA